jgi:hypothetical protein
LRMFVMVFKCFSCVFAGVSETVSSVSFVFKRMLKMLHLHVLKVDQMLHMLQCT